MVISYQVIISILNIVLLLLLGAFLSNIFDEIISVFYWAMILLPFIFNIFQGDVIRKNHNIGVCQTLKKDAYIVAVFMDDNESSWTQPEIEAFMANTVSEGIHFIEAQAVKYGHNVNIGLGTYREDGKVRTIPYDGVWAANSNLKKGAARNSWMLYHTSRELGYLHPQEMLYSDRRTTGEKQITYMFCLNKPGRSHASVDGWEPLFFNAMEYITMYSSYWSSDQSTTSGSVAHEILHLFGAEDYYTEDGKREHRSQLAQVLCPNDVMLVDHVDLSKITIDRYTAYTVGWLNKLPDEYKTLNWWR